LAGLCLLGTVAQAASFPSAIDYDGTWRFDPSLGWFVEYDGGWIWSEGNGFLYVTEEGNWDTDGVYFYDHGMQRWFYSDHDAYPWVYAWGDDMGWQKVVTVGSSGDRHFYLSEADRTIFEDGYVVTGTTYEVDSRSAFDDAVAAAGAGDLILVSGNLADTSFSVKNKVVADGYLRIRAADKGSTALKAFTIDNCEGISLEGFTFGPNTSSTLLKIVNSTRLQILQNTFDFQDVENNQNGIVTTQGTADVEIAYNVFKNKNVSATETQSKVSGSYIKTQYDEPQMTKRLHIHHNYFKGIVPLLEGDRFAGDSDRECIVFGVSDSQDVETHHVVEQNLFEDCDGENEIITIKTSYNTIRNNTFHNSLGSVSIRFGTGTEVSGNFFIGDENNQNVFGNDLGGIRAYGSQHKIYNNYFQGLTGNSYRIPILLDSGDTTDSTGGDGHQRATDCEVVHNTIVDCAWGIALGLNYSLTPKDNHIANNVVQNRKNALYYIGSNAQGESSNVFEHNIGHSLDAASIGFEGSDSEVWATDPQLEATNFNGWSIYRPTAASPVVDYGAAGYAYVGVDFEGQTRLTPDAGADEVGGGAPLIWPVNAWQVGPNPR